MDICATEVYKTLLVLKFPTPKLDTGRLLNSVVKMYNQ